MKSAIENHDPPKKTKFWGCIQTLIVLTIQVSYESGGEEGRGTHDTGKIMT